METKNIENKDHKECKNTKITNTKDNYDNDYNNDCEYENDDYEKQNSYEHFKNCDTEIGEDENFNKRSSKLEWPSHCKRYENYDRNN